jgi:hypothetical protein
VPLLFARSPLLLAYTVSFKKKSTREKGVEFGGGMPSSRCWMMERVQFIYSGYVLEDQRFKHQRLIVSTVHARSLSSWNPCHGNYRYIYLHGNGGKHKLIIHLVQ